MSLYVISNPDSIWSVSRRVLPSPSHFTSGLAVEFANIHRIAEKKQLNGAVLKLLESASRKPVDVSLTGIEQAIGDTVIGFIDDNENDHPHPGDTLDTCGPQYSVGDGIEKRGDLFFGKAGDFRNLCDRRAVGQQLFRDLSQSFGLSFGIPRSIGRHSWTTYLSPLQRSALSASR